MKHISSEEIHRIADVKSLSCRLKMEYANGMDDTVVPQRVSVLLENPFVAFDTMPAYSGEHKLFIAKIGAVIPQDVPTRPSVHAIVVAFSGRTGKPLAIFDGDAITNLKCAAVTAMVTDLCTPPEIKVLGLIGTGVQAREQIRGIRAVRQLEQIKVYSRNQDRVLNFIRENANLCSDAEFIACSSASEAVDNADVISTAMTSTEPVISMEALEGKLVHINCLGNHTTESRELPLRLLQQSLLIVEDVKTAVEEAGEIHRNAITIEQLVKQEISALRGQRTVFSSTGHAFLDLVTVLYLLAKLGLSDEACDES